MHTIDKMKIFLKQIGGKRLFSKNSSTWFIEYYKGNKNVEITILSKKEGNVYSVSIILLGCCERKRCI